MPEPEKLTACGECEHTLGSQCMASEKTYFDCYSGTIRKRTRFSHEEYRKRPSTGWLGKKFGWTETVIEYVHVPDTEFCSEVNTDCHCPHFEAKA